MKKILSFICFVCLFISLQSAAGNLIAEDGGKILIFGDFAFFDPPAGIDRFLAHKNVKRFPWEHGPEVMQESVATSKFGTDMSRPVLQNNAEFLRSVPGAVLRRALPQEPVVQTVTPGFHVWLYRQKKSSALTLHLPDMRDMLPPEGTVISQYGTLQNYNFDGRYNDTDIEISLKLSGIDSCTLISPSRQDELQIPVTGCGKKLFLQIPAGSFAGYAALKMM